MSTSPPVRVGRWRVLLGTLGVATIAYAGWLVLSGGIATDPMGLALWLGGAVAAHDGLLAPAVLLAGALSARLLPRWLRGPAQAGALVAGVLVLASLPLLLGQGRKPDNPSVDPLDYPRNLLLLLALVTLGTAVAGGIHRRQLRREQVHSDRNTLPPADQRSSNP